MLLSRLQDVVRLVDVGYRDAYELVFGTTSRGPQPGRSSEKADPTGQVATCGCSRPDDADPAAEIEHHCPPAKLKEVIGNVIKATAILKGANADLARMPKAADWRRERDIDQPENPRVGNRLK